MAKTSTRSLPVVAVNWRPKRSLNLQLRREAIRILDEEDAWEHVIINYLFGEKRYFARGKSGKPDLRRNTTRIIWKLAQLSPSWKEMFEEQSHE